LGPGIEGQEITPLILAGGLNKENIKRAIETVRPCAVDINSGVEISPRKKDPYKIREIMEIIRATDTDEAPGNIFTPLFPSPQWERGP
jgi:phosphoribosylanthranilate isomerase